jgi:hypothetical protein
MRAQDLIRVIGELEELFPGKQISVDGHYDSDCITLTVDDCTNEELESASNEVFLMQKKFNWWACPWISYRDKECTRGVLFIDLYMG